MKLSRQSLFCTCVLSFAIIHLGFLSLENAPALAAPSVPRVLVINSYHEGYDWSDDEMDGLRSTLVKSFPRVEINSEYLDTKNFPDNSHFPRIADLLEFKYRNTHFDVIAVTDNSALEFVSKYRKRLFNRIPVVFCGINDFTPGMLEGQSPITGVAENQDSVGTLALALKLHPSTRQVLVIHDYTVTGLAIRHELEAGLARFSGLNIHFLEDMRLEQAVDTLKKLPADSLVLILSYAVEKGGRTFTQAEAAKIISSSSPVPAYAIHAAQLGHGVVGGKLLTGTIQGQKAAELVVRIIHGTPANQLPVVTASLSKFMFDYSAVKKFSIDLDHLPPGAEIINTPPPTYAVNKTAFWLAALFTAAVSAGAITLYLNIQRRKRLEQSLRLTEAKFRQLFNCAGDAIFIHAFDGRMLEANQAGCDRMGYDHAEFLKLNISQIVAPGHAASIPERVEFLKRYGRILFESLHLSRTGRLIPVEVSSRVIDYEDQPAILSIARDITERKKTEEELHLKTRLLEQEIAEHQTTEQTLRVERNNLVSIFDSAPVGMVLLNSRTEIVSVNHIMGGLLRLPAEQIVRQRLGDVLRCPHNKENTEQCGETLLCPLCPLYKAIHAAMSRNEAVHGAEIQHDFAWSTEHAHPWIRFSVEPLVLGGSKHVVIAFDDITEKKQMEEQIRENEARLRLIFETSQSGLLLISPDGRIEFANDRMTEMFGCSLPELIGSSYGEYIEAAEWLSESSVMQQLLRGDISCGQMERTYLRKDGSSFWGYIAGQRLERSDGSLKAVVASITDISSLKLAVDELRAEKERLAVTLSSIGDGVITTDTKGRVVLINRVAEELCGWKQGEAAGLPLENVFRIIGEANRLPQQNPVAEVLSSGKIVELANHTILVSRSGAERAIADSAAPILNEKGAIIGVVLVFRDMTEKKHAEEEIFKARKLESIGVLAGGIAHDFNNFLTAILGNISLARMLSTSGERIHDILEKAESASHRARGLTQQLLTFAKGGAPIRKVVSIGQIITESVGFVLRGSNVRYECDIAADLLPVEVDAGQMSQVINNLVINADQAMPDGGLLMIRAFNEAILSPGSKSSAKYRIKITFEDQGVGIPPAHLSRVFDPYFSTKQQGSGLGLATVYSIIRKHNGEITATSQLGTGTTFTITLPAANGEGLYEDEEKDAGESHKGCGRILIMDDEEIICDVLSNMLDVLGYDTETCRDGAEAFELYRHALANGRAFDAVIMDITIPGGIGGKDAIVMLRKIDPSVRAIVSSGYANDPIMARFRDYGFEAALTKPYNIQEIGRLLSQILIN